MLRVYPLNKVINSEWQLRTEGALLTPESENTELMVKFTNLSQQSIYIPPKANITMYIISWEDSKELKSEFSKLFLQAKRKGNPERGIYRLTPALSQKFGAANFKNINLTNIKGPTLTKSQLNLLDMAHNGNISATSNVKL